MQTREFLRELSTADVPDAVRREARRLLRHYPSAVHIDRAATAWPDMWAPARGECEQALSYLELLTAVRKRQDLPGEMDVAAELDALSDEARRAARG